MKNNGKYIVNKLITKNGKVIAAEITDNNSTSILLKSNFWQVRGNLKNAVVTTNGIMRGTLHSLPKEEIKNNSIISNSNTNNIVKRYIIMYEDNNVLEINRQEASIRIINRKYLPFELRNKTDIQFADVINWLNIRLNNINRTYMNLVHLYRGTNRDNYKAIKDSSGVSFTDNFWIKTSDTDLNWDKLRKLRDINLNISSLALNGKTNGSDLLSGYTSLFTTKGYFPKAVIGGYIYKRKEDAQYDYLASIIGKQLGIDVEEVIEKDGYICKKIFTSDNVSLVHASSLVDYFNNGDLLYNNLRDRPDIQNQMQRYYIFNYIIGNPDLHDDNYGLLYDAKTFKFLKFAPCFDHNLAFNEDFDRMIAIRVIDIDIETVVKQFIKNHRDIVNKLKTIDLSVILKYLNNNQKSQLKKRIQNIIDWS